MRHLPADLAAALRRARHARGWSLTDAAAATGVSRSMISDLERGVRVPSVALAEDLISGYELRGEVVGWLLDAATPYAGRSSPYRTGDTPADPARYGSPRPRKRPAVRPSNKIDRRG